MPKDHYFDMLAEGSFGALGPDSPRVQSLAAAAASAGFHTDADIFRVLALKGGEREKVAPLTNAEQEDTQLRAWRGLLVGGPHLFIQLTNCMSEKAPRSRLLIEALGLLGHKAYLFDISEFQHTSDDLGSAVAVRIQSLLEADPVCDAVVLGYSENLLESLSPIRHHLQIMYGNPGNPDEGFQARYIHRSTTLSHRRGLSSRPLFSIVIPTRNNAICLEQNLRTCLEQPFTNFEVIIGDNSDPGNKETETLVRRLNSDKLHYFHTDRQADLSDSFEFAFARARGDYLLGLGSDDGLLWHGLSTLALALEKAGADPDAIRFDYLYYGWPNAQPKRFQNFIRIPPSIRKDADLRLDWVDSREALERFAKYQLSFHEIPNGYGYSILSRRLLDRILKSTGRYFPGLTQDLYTGVYALCFSQQFLRLDCPITAFAVSGSSIGAQNTYCGPNLSRVRHELDGPFRACLPPALERLDQEGRDSHYDPCTTPESYGMPALETCGYTSDECINALAIIHAVNTKVLSRDAMDLIDWRRYFEICANYLYMHDPLLDEKLREMRVRVERRQDLELEHWFRTNYYNNPNFRGHPTPPAQDRFNYGLLPNGVLYLDGADFGVTNVYDAVQLFRKFMGNSVFPF